MESQETTSTTESKGKSEYFSKVVHVPRYLLLLLFVILPFVGGCIGYYYDQENVVEVSQINETGSIDFPIPPPPSSIPIPSFVTDTESTTDNTPENGSEDIVNISEWLTYQNDEYHFAFDYPSDWNLYPGATWNLDSLLWGVGIGGNNEFDSELGLSIVKEVPNEVKTGIESVRDGQVPREIIKTVNEYGIELLHFYSFKEAQDSELLLPVYIKGKDHFFIFSYRFMIRNYDIAEQIIKSFRFTQ